MDQRYVLPPLQKNMAIAGKGESMLGSKKKKKTKNHPAFSGAEFQPASSQNGAAAVTNCNQRQTDTNLMFTKGQRANPEAPSAGI